MAQTGIINFIECLILMLAALFNNSVVMKCFHINIIKGRIEVHIETESEQENLWLHLIKLFGVSTYINFLSNNSPIQIRKFF